MQTTPPTPLWTPSAERQQESLLRGFMAEAAARSGAEFPDYQALYSWSIRENRQFWSLLWDFCKVIGDKGDMILANGADMERARWFPDARLNFAENLLRQRTGTTGVISLVEDAHSKHLSFPELVQDVGALAYWLRAIGVQRGDRVAGCLTNSPEALTAMLAAASLGAVWTAVSPDFGSDSIVERFAQTTPKVLFATSVSRYNGKLFDHRTKFEQIRRQITSLERLVLIDDDSPHHTGSAHTWNDVIATGRNKPLSFTRCAFNDPLYILYSSGTTGRPKCIVHTIGGTLLQHLKEHQLHCDIHPGDRVFYYTTCSWMMWNWLVSVLASAAVPVLYDGSPRYPDTGVLWRYAEQARVTLFGTSAKYLDLLRKEQFRPADHYDLSAIRTICSTGSVLAPEGFSYVYQAIKEDVCLASISGGTDIVSCFVLGCPILPVYPGESQCRGLGMAVEVFNEAGEAIIDRPGELVCTVPFPSQPLGFWGDDDGSRYHAAYFARYENVWHHGDFVTLTARGTMVIHGRSDTTLNPGGVRIGTAEIYRAVERLDEIIESIAIGQQWDNDIRIVLFVVLRPPLMLTDALREKTRQTVRASCSAHHVPRVIIQVNDIPRTKSGKIVETAVRDVIHGRPSVNLDALANPESLEWFRDHPELLS